MLTEDLIDVTIDDFGGYCPAVVPVNLPPGAANAANDVIFPEAGVRTRGGLNKYVFDSVTQITAGASINGLKTYLTPSGGQRFMIWDSLGEMFAEGPEGELRNIGDRPYQNLLYESQTLFGREYQAFFDAGGGFDIPRQFDDAHWDRVSQVGPGLAPVATDEINSVAIAAAPTGLVQVAPFAIATITETGNIVTVTFASMPVDVTVGDMVKIAGVTPASYNGTFPILSVNIVGTLSITYQLSQTALAAGSGGTCDFGMVTVTTSTAPSPAFLKGQSIAISGATNTAYNLPGTVRQISGAMLYTVYLGIYGTAASGGGSLSAAGNVVAGLHGVSVAFITRQGFITQAPPPTFWTSSGLKRASLAQIPTGPSNIVGRLLIFTPVITPPATTGTFYSLPEGSTQIPNSVMLIPDNVTTTATVDFTDTILIAGFNAEYLFSQLELGESAFFIPYNSRGVWLGERAKVPNFDNLTFDGGFSGVVPNGWTLDPLNGAGGGSANALNLIADWGDAYVIVGDGVLPITGKITQTAFQDSLQVPIIQANTSYSVRARVVTLGNPTQGTLHINLHSNSLGTTTGLAITAAQANLSAGKFAEYIGLLTVPIGTPPADLTLQVYVDGTPSLNGTFIVDSIEPFPTVAPVNSSIARLSRAFNPESFDSVTGQVQIRPGDGQQLRAGFPLRNSLYLAKDHYLGYVTDDGVNEPASWAFTEVSATTGICGPNAVDWNEEWAAFAERSGLYICWGSDPVKLTPEIQIDGSFQGRTSWASINWAAAQTIWVRIDRVNRMILVGAPINGATTPNIVFMMDYRWLDSAEDIASSPSVAYSGFTGKILSHGRGRKWALWSMTANSMWFAERADGTAQPFFGSGNNDSLLWEQFDCAEQPIDDLTDPDSGEVEGFQIPFSYQTYATPSTQEEQQYQLRAHRKLFGYLKFLAWGQGAINIAITAAQRSTILRAYPLAIIPFSDGGRPVNIHGERFFITFSYSTTAITWMQLERITACIKKDAAFLVRGVSS